MTSAASFLRALAASRFLRFSVVGGFGFTVDVSVFFLLHELLSVNAYAARPFSILSAMVCTWLGNRMLTFSDRAAEGSLPILIEWLKFAATNSIGAVFNYGTFAAVIAFAPQPFDNRYFALVAGTAVGLVFNFTMSKYLVFRAGPAAT
ncbi:MAG TPA: GtrA family protein [Rhizomicrobium sp.]|nr:GtrA family protein [Rhizomicrobium sp.]